MFWTTKLGEAGHIKPVQAPSDFNNWPLEGGTSDEELWLLW